MFGFFLFQIPLLENMYAYEPYITTQFYSTSSGLKGESPETCLNFKNKTLLTKALALCNNYNTKYDIYQ